MQIYNVNLNRYNHIEHFSQKKHNITFTSNVPLYKVKNTNPIKNILPTIAFIGSAMGSLGYLIGGSALFYDLKHEKKNNSNKHESTSSIILDKFQNPTSIKKSINPTMQSSQKETGVKSITPITKTAKIGMNCTKIGMTASSIAGVSCGLCEGLPLMALGESTNIASARIIETPVGTGLFGIGIASIFAGLALDNTPNLKLNSFEVMAEKSTAKKAHIYLKNMKTTAKEIGSSIFEIGKNILKPKWLKENIFQGTPRNIIFSEKINKDGKIFLEKTLRHNKNYLMNAASFTLTLGGTGIILSSLFKKSKTAKKAQKVGLKVEEGGFLFDNFGITRYGMDKITNGGKSAGISFATGGIINAVSQFIGLDNKDGRALQWLGIAPVFLGYSIDRGKNLKEALKLAKQRPELTQTVREWKINLGDIITNKKELKQLLKEIKSGKPTTNEKFNTIEKSITTATTKGFKKTNDIKEELNTKLGTDISQHIHDQNVMDYQKAKNILRICTEKIFGSKNPTPVL